MRSLKRNASINRAIKMRNVFSGNNISLDISKMLCAFGITVWCRSVDACGDHKRILSFKIWVYRRIFNISWIEHVLTEKF